MALSKSDLKFLRSNGGIHPKLIELFEEVSDRKDKPYDFVIAKPYGGRRTAQMQKRLHRKGASKKDGYKRKSRHQSGCAIDIVCLVNGKKEWNSRKVYSKMTKFVKSVAKESGLKMRHGSDWKWFDGFHHELDKRVYRRYTPWQTSGSNLVLVLNAKNAKVKNLQQNLVKLGFKLKIDSHYGKKTIAKVKAFQTREGLRADGIVGPSTWLELRAAVKELKLTENLANKNVKIVKKIASSKSSAKFKKK